MKNDKVYNLLVFMNGKKHKNEYILTTHTNAKELLHYPDESIEARFWIAYTGYIQGIFKYLKNEEGNNTFELSIKL